MTICQSHIKFIKKKKNLLMPFMINRNLSITLKTNVGEREL